MGKSFVDNLQARLIEKFISDFWRLNNKLKKPLTLLKYLWNHADPRMIQLCYISRDFNMG